MIGWPQVREPRLTIKEFDTVARSVGRVESASARDLCGICPLNKEARREQCCRCDVDVNNERGVGLLCWSEVLFDTP